jgi:hypothetical protein
MAAKLPLPNLGTAFEYAGIQYLLAQEFGKHFFEIVDVAFKSHNVNSWFEQIQQRRAKDKQPVYDDAKDPRFLLKEAVYWDSELRLVVPLVKQTGWDDGAKKLTKALNSWSHQKLEPTADAFLRLLVEMEAVSIPLALEDLCESLEQLIERTKQIRNGAWVPEASEVKVPQDAGKYANEVVEKVEEVKQRPPVGHEWIGEAGKRIVDLSRATRDVYESGASIRAELGENAEEKITSWLRYYPQGGKLRIDTDGAVLGFKQGVGYLIGWFGEEPGVKPEESRGFYLPHEYEFVPTDIIDVQTGERLSRVAAEPIDWVLNTLARHNIPFNAVLNMTIYGDLVYVRESGQEQKIVTVHKDVWFPGQLREIGGEVS